MQRVNVYRLNEDGQWDDRGTGHVTIDYMERSEELCLYVIDEDDNATLLVHRISTGNIYKKQEDSIISWRDPERSVELALSFEETAGCTYIWNHISSTQRILHFNSLNSETFDNTMSELKELPGVNRANLPLKIVTENGITAQMRVTELMLKDEMGISPDLLVEFWSKMQLEKVFRMKLVSKSWATLIDSSANYIASRQPRIFFTYINAQRLRRFRSVSQHYVYPRKGRSEKGASFAHFDVTSPPVNGLFCLRSDDSTSCSVKILNILTGKSVTLPKLQKNVGVETSLFFGWDHVDHQFKVLCVGVEKRLSEVLVMPQIFSLKGKSSSWRGISCVCSHLPIDSKSGMCKDGVIYYAAWNINQELSVMSFNLNSEKFSPLYCETITKTHKTRIQMMNYNGDVSLVIGQPLQEGYNRFRFDIRIMKTKHLWEPISSILIGDDPYLKYKPIFCNGSLVFAPGCVTYFIDPKKNKGKKTTGPRKVEIDLVLQSYEPNKKGRFDRRFVHYDSFVDQIYPVATFIDVQSFVGTVWDLGGQDRLRTSWATYYRGTHTVIVVIDSTDRARISFMKDELARILGHEDLQNSVILVFAKTNRI